jgi:hypothetical protein
MAVREVVDADRSDGSGSARVKAELSFLEKEREEVILGDLFE